MAKRTGLLLAALLSLAGCKNKFEDMKQAALTRDAGPAVAPVPAGATLIAHGQNVPRDLLVDGSHLFWLNEGRRAEGTPGVYSVSKEGGEVKELVSGLGVHGLALDDQNIYWIHPENGTVSKAPKGGGAAESLATEQENLSAIAVDDTHVYWAGGTGIYRVEKAGGKVQAVVDNISLPNGLHVDDQHVYWYSIMSGKLARAPKKGGKPSSLVEEEVTLHAFFIDGDSLYWSYGSEKKAKVKKMAKAGGKPLEVVTGQDVPGDFAFDESHIFWLTPENIFKAPKAGGSAEKIVEGMDRAIDLNVDGSYVFWTDRIGRIQRMKK